ncbi:MAG TPA: hypothetical protein VK013_17320 [Myxococcaceae bacterium]|nr:hypothetical protein [Myxococcaceae bacterium]
MRALPLLAAIAVVGTGCVKQISNEARLDREAPTDEVGELNYDQLARISCGDTEERLKGVRQLVESEDARLHAYAELHESLRERTHTLGMAIRRDQDLLYIEDYRSIIDAHADCEAQQASVANELERFTRELVAVPTVNDVKDGKRVTSLRVDPTALRNAIDALNLPDEAELYEELLAAERSVAAANGR